MNANTAINPATPGTLRVATYARCSTDDQAEGDFTTIRVQQDLNRERARSLGASVVAELSDEGRTGTNLDRPGWKRLLALAESRQIDAVILTYMSRLGRGEAYTVAEWLLRQARVQILLVQESFTPDLAGRMHKKTKLFIDSLYADQISEWTRTKQAAMVAQGYWTGGVRPFGYCTEPAPGTADVSLPGGKIKRAPRRLVPDPLEGPVVQAAFSLFAVTLNQGDVQRLLRRDAPGRSWQMSRVTALLRNPTYRGVQTFGPHVNESAHQPLIDVATWDAVQVGLTKVSSAPDSQQPSSRPRRPDAINGWVRPSTQGIHFHLRGRIWCAHCGCRMTPATATGRAGRLGYYQCIRGTAGGAVCPVGRVNAHTLHDVIVGHLAAFGAHPSRLERALTAARAQLDAAPPAGELPALRAQLRQVSRQIERLVRAVKAGGQSAALAREIAALEERELALESRVQEVVAARDRLRLPRPDVKTLAGLWQSFAANWEYLTGDERTEVFSLLVDRVEFQEKRKGSLALRLSAQTPLDRFADNQDMGAVFAIAANHAHAFCGPSEILKFALEVPGYARRSGLHGVATDR